MTNQKHFGTFISFREKNFLLNIKSIRPPRGS
ncbi:MAG: hypothetical protein MRERC_2c093 [Mycoplasmataceae bacterium RC_NB112A]|nr:MAG: hypothetical protein MRERC_2c093 [Mycoplasmataceae bacterium RC_NB112A]